MDALLARHRKEAKDLQARITSKKKNATKKTRKGVNDECAVLESDLKSRHASELASFSSSSPSIHSDPQPTSSVDLVDPFAPDPDLDNTSRSPSSPPSSDLTTGIADLSINSGVNETTDSDAPKRKPNRQKARLARRAAEQEAAVEAAAAESQLLPDHKAREREIMAKVFESRGLVEHEVRSDGHCLYAALADQLGSVGIEIDGDESKEREREGDFRAVRREVAGFVLAHQDDFAPFLDEDELEENGVEGYARRIGETATWGGQMEILAGARRWGLVVNVVQGDGRVERIEGTEGGKDCWLAYYKHSFGLGEHYNSLRKKKQT